MGINTYDTDSNAEVDVTGPRGIVPLSKPFTVSWYEEKLVGIHPVSTPGFGDITILQPSSGFNVTIATNVSVSDREYHSPPLESFGVPPGDLYEFEFLPTKASPLQWGSFGTQPPSFNVTAE